MREATRLSSAADTPGGRLPGRAQASARRGLYCAAARWRFWARWSRGGSQARLRAASCICVSIVGRARPAGSPFADAVPPSLTSSARRYGPRRPPGLQFSPAAIAPSATATMFNFRQARPRAIAKTPCAMDQPEIARPIPRAGGVSMISISLSPARKAVSETLALVVLSPLLISAFQASRRAPEIGSCDASRARAHLFVPQAGIAPARRQQLLMRCRSR